MFSGVFAEITNSVFLSNIFLGLPFPCQDVSLASVLSSGSSGSSGSSCSNIGCNSSRGRGGCAKLGGFARRNTIAVDR